MRDFFGTSIAFLLCVTLFTGFSGDLQPNLQPLFGEPLQAQSVPAAEACDADALPCAKELLAYLREIAGAEKLIFGHQNDTSFTIRPNILSDTEDLTGDISGIVGMDSLDLTGQSMGSGTQAKGLADSIQISLDAAGRGALITLSAHMPNFSSSKIQQFDDGSYSFIRCTLDDTRDVDTPCAEECLPGGAYQPVFHAYLDLIAEYGLALQAQNIPVLFRPFHEGNGSWFWWGGDNAEADVYVALFRYTKDYLTEKGVHNFLYVYSPNGPAESEADYMDRYPGDGYVDVMAVDYYNGGYESPSSQYSEEFFADLNDTCQIISRAAAAHGKLPAISETGLWVRMGIAGQDGLLEKGNPMNDKAWYQKVGAIAIENGMPYYLIWRNCNLQSFNVPFKYDDTHAHEMADDFIDFYNEPASLFAGELHFYERLAAQ